MPGFPDPLGLAGVVDLEQLGHRREFVHDLGAQELTFASYAEHHVPRAFQDRNLPLDRRQAVVRLLATELGRIQDNQDVRRALSELPLVECEGGSFYLPEEVYFPTEIVAHVLGSKVPVAKIPSEHAATVTAFYRWLGVADRPRLEDVLAHIVLLTSVPPTETAVAAVRVLFGHLGERLRQGGIKEESLSDLRSCRWLPAKGKRDRWYRPDQLFASFNASLFQSQADFLDFPQTIEQTNSDFLEYLGVEKAPRVSQVVAHLLHCSEAGILAPRGIYDWLNNQVDDPAIRQLVGKACLDLGEGRFVVPQHVFWNEHPFGHLRQRLGEQLLKYHALLKLLGVRPSPDYTDAIEVIKEITAEHGPVNRRLDPEVQRILFACWQMLDSALDTGVVAEQVLNAFRHQKVICSPAGVLYLPERMFFDDRAGLVTKFADLLEQNVIPRSQGAWRAMEAAGVRPLSKVVRCHLLEGPDPVDAPIILERARERRLQLARILDFQAPGLAERLNLLDVIRPCAVGDLRIRYEFREFGKPYFSQPECVPTHMAREGEHPLLYFVPRDGQPPWPAIAREFALYLCPDLEPGQLASAIKEVLAAETPDSARLSLDQFGFPQIHVPSSTLPAAPPPVEELGSQAKGQEAQSDTVASQPPEPPAGAGLPGMAEEAIRGILGPDVSGPAPPPAELDKPEPAGVGGAGRGEGCRGTPGALGEGHGGRGPGGTGTGSPPMKRKGYAVLRSYVMPDRPTDETPMDHAQHEQRSAVDQAGVNRVMQYEGEQGRQPREMPPQHPGYDIESHDLTGQIERYIEVKSLSGDWSGAALSDTQFDKAEELGERYWLYVVERAEQDDYTIFRIQDPARKVTQFIYDAGWQEVAEHDDGPEQSVSVEKQP